MPLDRSLTSCRGAGQNLWPTVYPRARRTPPRNDFAELPVTVDVTRSESMRDSASSALMNPGRLAYLVAQYPAINHGFMLREIIQLRRSGWDIATFSIAPPDRPEHELTADELLEYRRTRYVKPERLRAMIAGSFYVLTHPVRFLSALRLTLRLGHLTPGALLRRLIYLAEAILLGRWITQAGMAHLHTHYSSTVALFVSRLYPVTFSVTVHGPDELQDPVAFALVEKLNSARLTVAISHYAKSQLMRFSEPDSWPRIAVSYLGTPLREPPRRHYRRSDEPIRFLSVGRLAPVKGQHALVAASARLAATGRRFCVSVVGGGPSADSLLKAIKLAGTQEAVRLEGRVSNERLHALYEQADVFVLPSFAEGVPGVLMEAMMLELPCNATSVNGIPELIENGVHGLLVPPAD